MTNPGMEKEGTHAQKIVILTAPSGAGKTTIAYRLMKKLPSLVFSISVTTRAPRGGEEDGVDYYFVSPEEFKRRIGQNAFIEYEEPYKNKFYGTMFSELERIWKDHHYPLRIVEVKGAAQLKKRFKDRALSLFIKPPSLEALKQRLLKRGEEDLNSITERMERAKEEMMYENRFDKVILNDKLEVAVQEAYEEVKSFLES